MLNIIRGAYTRWHKPPKQKKKLQPDGVIKKLGDNVHLFRFGAERYVVKIFASEAAFVHERDILSRLADLPGCVGCIDASEQCITMTYCSGGDLIDYYNWHAAEFTVAAIARIICQLCDIVQRMHERGVHHLDLKLENICLMEDALGEICLIDFGSAEIIDDEPLKQIVSTKSYMSPEYIRIAEDISKKLAVSKQRVVHIDIWAIGVIAFSLLFGEYPFGCAGLWHTKMNVMRLRYSMPADTAVPRELQDILARIFVLDDEKRPRLTEIRDVFARYTEKKHKEG